MSPITTFLVVAFGFSWACGLAQYVIVASTGPSRVVSTIVGVVFMMGPLVGALVAERNGPKGVLRRLGTFALPKPGWLLIPFAMVAYAFLALVFGLAFDGVTWSPDFSGMIERLGAILPAEELAAAKEQMEGIPPVLMGVMLVVQPVIFGSTINAIVAFGEELGWRGFMYQRLEAWGFWRRSLVIGAVWGVWHAPLILQGYNYPDHPVIGVFMMTLWTIALAPMFTFVREQTGSVIAASVAHGALNASAGIGFMFLSGGTDLQVGVTGLAGIAAAFVFDGAIFVYRRAKNPTAKPVGPQETSSGD